MLPNQLDIGLKIGYNYYIMKKNITAIILISIVLAGGLPYVNSLHNPFIWDEEAIIVNNPIIKQWKYLTFLFKTNIFGGPIEAGGFYRPFYMLSFMADYHFWKLNPMGYHFFSIIFHILNAMLFYVFIIKLGLQKKIAWLASLLFALFPVNAEAVTLIAARVELITSFLLLACFILFLNGIKISRFYFLGSILLFILSIFTKESALLLPLIALIYTLIFLEKKEMRKTFPPLLTLISIVFIYGGLRILFLGSPFHRTLSLINEAAFIERVYTFPRILLTYIQLIVMPIVLKSEYHFVVHSFKDAYVLLGTPLLILLFTLINIFLKPRKYALFFSCWFLIGLAPYSNLIIPLHATLMEHWGYFSSMGFAALMSITFFKIKDGAASRRVKYAAVLIMASLMLFYALRIIERNREWNDPFTLYQKDVEKEPNSFLLHCNLGVEYFRRGMMEEARKEFIASNKACPGRGYDVAYNNLGVIYAREGRIPEAVSCYKQSIALNNYALAYANLAELYNNLRMREDAVLVLKEGIKLYPLNDEIQHQLSAAHDGNEENK